LNPIRRRQTPSHAGWRCGVKVCGREGACPRSKPEPVGRDEDNIEGAEDIMDVGGRSGLLKK
jgi:hypothetical protein